MKRPSMRKIAELAGVSVAAVSYALNNKPGISEQTRRRILQIMDDEQYISPSGTALLPHSQKYLYLVIDDLSSFSNLFYASILDTITTASSKFGYHIVLCNRAVSFQTTAAAAAIRHGQASGVIFLHDIEDETQLFLDRHETPFVIIDSHGKTTGAARISADYETAVFAATQHLTDLGHRKLAFIGQGELPDFYSATMNGFRKALSQAGLELQPQWIKDGACDFDSAYRCMDEILQSVSLPDGVVCAADQFALAAMHCAQNRGFAIPQDLSFVGVDDLPVSQIYHPPLTTIHIDVSELAEKAVAYLHRQICTPSAASDAVHTIRSDQLIVRASTDSCKK